MEHSAREVANTMRKKSWFCKNSKNKQVAQGQYVVSNTLCPALQGGTILVILRVRHVFLHCGQIIKKKHKKICDYLKALQKCDLMPPSRPL